MITVRFFRKDGRIRAYRVQGHAGFAQRGTDIVCAAVSAMAESCANGLEYAGLPVGLSLKEGQLDVYAHVRGELSGVRAQAILDTFWLGVRQMQMLYPKHVRLIDIQWR